MCGKSLRDYNYLPEEMRAYKRNYGTSFSKRACEFAVSKMARRNKDGKMEKIEPWDRNKVEELLKKYGVKLENNVGYNFVYVANMLVADKWGSSISDEQHLALGIKDEIDDVDVCKDSVFNCWITKMEDLGIPIPWEDMI